MFWVLLTSTYGDQYTGNVLYVLAVNHLDLKKDWYYNNFWLDLLLQSYFSFSDKAEKHSTPTNLGMKLEADK